MNREKHIREMSDIIYENRPIKDIWNEEADSIAENLYNAGYRKQSEGEWIWKSNGYKNRLHCSICNKPNEADISTNFCPNCGAKMFVQTEIKDYPPYLDRPKMKGGAE